MHELIIAFGLMLILEGIMPALFPNRWQQYVKKSPMNQPPLFALLA